MTEPRIPMEQGLADALRPVPAPATLRSRLMAEARHLDRARRRTRFLGIAATLALGLVGTWTILRGDPDPGMELARAAATRHGDVAHLDFQGAPPDATNPCGSWCKSRLGYTAALPRSIPASDVVGGRICDLRTHPVAYYRLACGDGLFVFQRAPKELQRARGFALKKGCSAMAWTEGDRAYLRVTKDPR